MGTSASTIDFLLDQLSGLAGVSARKMFGEYALYFDGKVVGLVCDDQLFVKITPAGKEMLGPRYREGEAYPGAKPSMLIDADGLEDADWLCELVRVTAAGLPAPKPKKPKKPRRSRAK
jgi:DNA transformation protein and related proteins